MQKEEGFAVSGSLFQLTVLGTRGSVPVCGRDYSVFGGNTSCYMVTAGEETIFLDAGSGLVNAPVSFSSTPVILLSHLHLDHILGLGMYPRLSRKGTETRLYLPVDEGVDAVSLLNGLYSPPYWPLSLTDYAGSLEVNALKEPFMVGDVAIDWITGSHPGGSLVFRLRYRGKTLVYVTDYERDDASYEMLISFARDADLLMVDGQYTTEEYPKRRGFGHSTPEIGIELKDRCNAKRLLLIHHDPGKTDRIMLLQQAILRRENVRFAREGEVYSI